MKKNIRVHVPGRAKRETGWIYANQIRNGFLADHRCFVVVCIDRDQQISSATNGKASIRYHSYDVYYAITCDVSVTVQCELL